jgi:hypothetical protein
MDPVSAQGLSGLGGLGGGYGKIPKAQVKGPGGKFEALRLDKVAKPVGDGMSADQMAQNFFKTGKLDGIQKAPSMAERVAMRDGIAFQPMEATQQAWRPNQVQATGESQGVASAIDNLNSGQERMDDIIGQLRSGKEFSQPELLGLQAEVNMLSEQIQMSSKLVDAAMQSIKQVMQQQA